MAALQNGMTLEQKLQLVFYLSCFELIFSVQAANNEVEH